MIDWIFELIGTFVAEVLGRLNLWGWIILLSIVGGIVLACVYL